MSLDIWILSKLLTIYVWMLDAGCNSGHDFYDVPSLRWSYKSEECIHVVL